MRKNTKALLKTKTSAAGEKLLNFSQYLDITFDYKKNLLKLAKDIIPTYGDICILDLLEANALNRFTVCYKEKYFENYKEVLIKQDLSIQDDRIKQVLQSKKALYIPPHQINNEKNGNNFLPLLKEHGITSAMILPLTTRKKMYGLLILLSRRGESKNQATVKVAEEIAKIAAMIIDNARLIEAEKKARQAMEVSANKIARIQTVTASLSNAITLTQFAEVIVNHGVPVIGANAGSIALLKDDGETIKIIRSTGYSTRLDRKWRETNIHISSPLTDAIRSGNFVLIETLEEFGKKYPTIYNNLHTKHQAFACVPLRVNNKIIGGLGFSFLHAHVFTEDDKLLMQYLVRQCSLTLERTQLYENEKKARSEIEHSQKNVKNILESISDAFFALDSNSCFTYLNSKALSLLQRLTTSNVKEFIGKNMWDEFPEARRSGFYDYIQKAIKTHRAIRFEEYFPKLNLWFDIHVYATKNGVSLYFSDITKRKHAESTLLFLSKARSLVTKSIDYHTTLKHVASLIVPFVADWCAIDLNEDGNYKRVVVIHKDKSKQKLAKYFQTHYQPDINAPAGAGMVLRTGKAVMYPTVSEELAFASARNNPKILSIIQELGFSSYITVPLISRKKILGAISCMLGNGNRTYTKTEFNLTIELAKKVALAVENAQLFKKAQEELKVRRKMETQLRNSRNQLEIIFQGVGDGITVQDRNGKLIYANDAAGHSVGLSSAEAVLHTPLSSVLKNFELTDDLDRPFPLENLPGRRALLGEKEPQSLIKFKNLITGKERWSLVKARPVYDQDGSILYAINIFHDITERRQLELRKDDFIGIASHELKTPLTTIKALTQILQKKSLKTNDEETSRFLSKMDVQLDKLTYLINDLLDISKIQTGKLGLKVEPFDITDLIQETVEEIQRISDKKIIVRGITHKEILGDRDRIYQVIVNLLTNAIKYSPNHSTITVDIENNKKEVIVSVSDKGIGIPIENHDKVFERFFRVNGPKGETYPGLGVGLYISSEIIKRHSGKIWLRSKLGKGSTFYFSLPITNTKTQIVQVNN